MQKLSEDYRAIWVPLCGKFIKQNNNKLIGYLLAVVSGARMPPAGGTHNWGKPAIAD
jgi:hypothetical protein